MRYTDETGNARGRGGVPKWIEVCPHHVARTKGAGAKKKKKKKIKKKKNVAVMTFL